MLSTKESYLSKCFSVGTEKKWLFIDWRIDFKLSPPCLNLYFMLLCSFSISQLLSFLPFSHRPAQLDRPASYTRLGNCLCMPCLLQPAPLGQSRRTCHRFRLICTPCNRCRPGTNQWRRQWRHLWLRFSRWYTGTLLLLREEHHHSLYQRRLSRTCLLSIFLWAHPLWLSRACHRRYRLKTSWPSWTEVTRWVTNKYYGFIIRCFSSSR